MGAAATERGVRAHPAPERVGRAFICCPGEEAEVVAVGYDIVDTNNRIERFPLSGR